MSEPEFIVINTEDRWRMGKEITDEGAIDLKEKQPVFLRITREGLSLEPGKERGTYVAGPIDSTVARCAWHRLVVDVDLPQGARTEMAYAVTDEGTDNLEELQDKWSGIPANSKDALISGQGKYIWIRIVIIANITENKAPLIGSITLHFPRETYLRYLPATYQEDTSSRHFLERYLSIFESVFSKLEDSIYNTPRLFDAHGTREEFLPWLSTWLGAVQDENWPEEKWREFLGRAAELYKQRGTRAGLSELIKIYTGKYPFAIVERGLLECSNDSFGKVLDRLFGCKYSFCVLLKPDQVKTETDRKVLKRMIDMEKPAHTCGGLVVSEDLTRLDWHAYLEINTVLREPKPEMRIGKMVIPIGTVLKDEPMETICRYCFESREKQEYQQNSVANESCFR